MGANLSSVPIDEVRPERRRATILFADIKDSTLLIRDLDPEEARYLLDPPLKVMVDSARRYGGTISHILGDGIMAIFGAPTANEDHAVMACLAALAILRGLHPRQGTDIRARIGIHSGEVLLRHLQVGENRLYDSVGATVHIAARLEQTARPGTACLSAATYELAKDFIEVRRLNAVVMKGIAGKVDRYLLSDMNLAANRWSIRYASGLSTFVGRSSELKWLAAALATSKSGQKRAAHLYGPPGIGKSRLVHEFLTNGAGSCCVFKLVGSPHTREAAFQPLRSWLLDWVQIKPSDSAAAAHVKLHKAVGRFEQLSEVHRSQLSNLLGLRDRPSPGADPVATLIPLQAEEALATLFAGIAGGKPIILAFDDIDCFDQTSLDLIEALVTKSTYPSLLVVTTSRTQFRFSRQTAPNPKSRNLKPLSTADAERLLALQDPRFTVDPELTQSVIQKTSGNPLFIEEVASLVAQSQPPGDRLGAVIDRSTLKLPDRIEALIAARLSTLTKKQHHLLQLCALIGDDIPLFLLRPLAGIDEADLQRRLEALQGKRLIHKSEREEGYSFRHSLIRDVCFNNMLASVRRQYHAQILAILEQATGSRHDERIDDLCYHAIHAEQWRRAIAHLRAAADAAIEKSAFQLGELYLVRASAIAAKLPDGEEILRARIEILLSLRTLVGATGKYGEANRLLEEAEELAGKLGDRDIQARVLAFRVHVLNILGDLNEALSAGARSRSIALKYDDRSLLALSNLVLAQAHFNRGEFLKAETTLLENAALLRDWPIDLRLGAIATLTVSNPATLAMVQSFQGRFGDAERSADLALRAANVTGRPYDMSVAKFSQGYALLHRRSADLASAAFGQSLEIANRNELTQIMPPALVGLGQARLLALDLEDSVNRLEAGRSLSITQNRYMIQIWATSSLALATARLGAMRDALRLGQEAVKISERFGFVGYQIPALRSLGLAYRAAGSDDAHRLLTKSLALSQGTGAIVESGHCHVALGICDRAGSNFEEARQYYAKAGMEKFLQRLMTMPSGDRVCLL